MNAYIDTYLFGYLLIFLGIIITISANIFVKSIYRKYIKINNSSKMTGFDVARKILDKNNLSMVHVVEVPGELSDHYDPARKVVRLSASVFHEETISSMAIAAHEVGHALQDDDAYAFMRFRSAMVPFVNFTSRIGYIAILIGFLFGIADIIYVAIGMELAVLLFNLVTLPVEFNASKRALKELKELSIARTEDIGGCSKVLKAAALTYVASLITVLLQLLRLLLIARGRHRD